MNVLVIDVGGSHVKLARSDTAEHRRFDSSPDFTPADLLQQVRAITADWEYEVVSLGLPTICGSHGAEIEPANLGDGWIGFDFQKAFERPVRIVNDATMQALGAYDGGRMLFLGLGTGLGSTLIVDRVVIPLELGSLHDIEDTNREFWGIRLGKKSMETLGETEWKKTALDTVCMLKEAFTADYVVIGGGHASLIDPLPENVRRGENEDAITGGFRLWEEMTEPHDAPVPSAFRVVH